MHVMRMPLEEVVLDHGAIEVPLVAALVDDGLRRRLCGTYYHTDGPASVDQSRGVSKSK